MIRDLIVAISDRWLPGAMSDEDRRLVTEYTRLVRGVKIEESDGTEESDGGAVVETAEGGGDASEEEEGSDEGALASPAPKKVRRQMASPAARDKGFYMDHSPRCNRAVNELRDTGSEVRASRTRLKAARTERAVLRQTPKAKSKAKAKLPPWRQDEEQGKDDGQRRWEELYAEAYACITAIHPDAHAHM